MILEFNRCISIHFISTSYNFIKLVCLFFQRHYILDYFCITVSFPYSFFLSVVLLKIHCICLIYLTCKVAYRFQTEKTDNYVIFLYYIRPFFTRINDSELENPVGPQCQKQIFNQEEIISSASSAEEIKTHIKIKWIHRSPAPLLAHFSSDLTTLL